MEPTEWKYSNLNPDDYTTERPKLEAGAQYLYIKDAEFDGNFEIMKFTFTPLSSKDGVEFTQGLDFTKRLYLKRSGSDQYNPYSIRWLNALGYACSGQETILLDTEYQGCVFQGTIFFAPSYKDKEQYETDMKEKGRSDIKVYADIKPEDILPLTVDAPEGVLAYARDDQYFE